MGRRRPAVHFLVHPDAVASRVGGLLSDLRVDAALVEGAGGETPLPTPVSPAVANVGVPLLALGSLGLRGALSRRKVHMLADGVLG